MNKQIKLVSILIVALCFCVMFTGCKKELTQSDIDGYWIVQNEERSSLDEDQKTGIFSAYYFGDDGSFKMILQVMDESLERVGTYRIDGDKVFVDVAGSSRSASVNGISWTIGAIENGEITIDGDTLTAKGVSADGREITAKKITSEQYEEYVAKAEAMGPKEIKLGEQVETDLASIKVDSFGYQTKINPPDTSGYYQCYESISGTKFLLAKITYTNKGTDYSIPGYAFNASFNVDGNNYSGEMLFAADSMLGESYSVGAKETRTLYAYCSVPDAVVDAGGTAKMTLSIPKEQQRMSTYYQESFPSDRFVITK